MQGLTEKIKEKGAAKGMSVRKIEIEAGLSNGAIARWSEKSPSIDKVFRVARVLDCRVDDLIGFETDGTEDEQYFRSVAGQ